MEEVIGIVFNGLMEMFLYPIFFLFIFVLILRMLR